MFIVWSINTHYLLVCVDSTCGSGLLQWDVHEIGREYPSCVPLVVRVNILTMLASFLELTLVVLGKPQNVPFLVVLLADCGIHVLLGSLVQCKGLTHPSSCFFLVGIIYFVFPALSFLCHSFFAVGSSDMSCRIFSLQPIEGFHYVTLAAHRGAIVACFFEHQSLNVGSLQLTVSWVSVCWCSVCDILKSGTS